MNNILILYPKQFNCYSKFSRKIKRIVQNMQDFSIIFPNDTNGFISKFFHDEYPKSNLSEKIDWDVSQITHAIVFDDGEEFPEITDDLNAKNIPFRIIKISITRVINIKKESQYQNIKSTPNYEYIGRGSYWGNPYSMYEEGDDRDEVIRKYKYDFDYDKFPNKDKSEVYQLSGKRLGCFCKPKTCHGDVLAEFLNSLDDGK